jgi:hypothetical protein
VISPVVPAPCGVSDARRIVLHRASARSCSPRSAQCAVRAAAHEGKGTGRAGRDQRGACAWGHGQRSAVRCRMPSWRPAPRLWHVLLRVVTVGRGAWSGTTRHHTAHPHVASCRVHVACCVMLLWNVEAQAESDLARRALLVSQLYIYTGALPPHPGADDATTTTCHRSPHRW